MATNDETGLLVQDAKTRDEARKTRVEAREAWDTAREAWDTARHRRPDNVASIRRLGGRNQKENDDD